MVNQDPLEHDELYVQLWGIRYREHAEFQAWLVRVNDNPARSLRSFKNDLTDLLRERKNPSKRRPQGWGG